MAAEGHLARYREHKEFFCSGITDKNRFPGWYVTAMYFAIYHLTCYYYESKGDGYVPQKLFRDKYAQGGDFSEYWSKFLFFEQCQSNTLYQCLRLTERDVQCADRYFPQFEQLLLS